MGESTETGKNYMLERGRVESMRLHTQDWIWGQSMGFHLHPRIQEAYPHFASVVDIGCANGIWVLTLALQKPNWAVTGLDVDTEAFPHNANVPQNAKLIKLNAFEPIPKEYQGVFDVLHIRTILLVIKGGDPVPLLKNIKDLIKPGGHIQWEELDGATFRAHSPSSSISTTNTSELLKRYGNMNAGMGLQFGWVAKLAAHFVEAGYVDTTTLYMEPKPALRRAWTDNIMVAFDEVGRFVGKNPALAKALGGEDEFKELLKNVGLEINSGASVDVNTTCVIGRKPS